MMGHHPPPNDPLFSYNVQLETRVRKDHPLRRSRNWSTSSSSTRKWRRPMERMAMSPSLPRSFSSSCSFSYSTMSARKENSWRPSPSGWIGSGFSGSPSSHPFPTTAFSRRQGRRWGQEAFRHFFERIVVQCVEAGIVDGTKDLHGLKPYRCGCLEQLRHGYPVSHEVSQGRIPGTGEKARPLLKE